MKPTLWSDHHVVHIGSRGDSWIGSAASPFAAGRHSSQRNYQVFNVTIAVFLHAGGSCGYPSAKTIRKKKKLFIFELVVNLMIISDKNELMMKTKYLENSYESGSCPVV